MQSKPTGTTDIMAMGIAAQLPGIKIAIMELQAHYDRLRDQLAQLQGAPETNGSARDYIAKRIGRPPGVKNKLTPGRRPGMRPSGWPEDEEARKAEMRRRMAVSKGKAPRKRSYGVTSNGKTNKDGLPQKMHPRDVNHPDHAAYAAKLRAGQKRYWDNLSSAQRKARVNTMAHPSNGAAA